MPSISISPITTEEVTDPTETTESIAVHIFQEVSTKRLCWPHTKVTAYIHIMHAVQTITVNS